MTNNDCAEIKRTLSAIAAPGESPMDAFRSVFAAGGYAVDGSASRLMTDGERIAALTATLRMAEDECRRLRAELDGYKQYAAVNPLGGPANMLYAAAERIMAGEEYWAVLADYGMEPTTAAAGQKRSHGAENAKEQHCSEGL